jgi:hypothetical protein
VVTDALVQIFAEAVLGRNLQQLARIKLAEMACCRQNRLDKVEQGALARATALACFFSGVLIGLDQTVSQRDEISLSFEGFACPTPLP